MALINKAQFQFKTDFVFFSFFVTFHIQSFTSIICHKPLWSYKQPRFTYISLIPSLYLFLEPTITKDEGKVSCWRNKGDFDDNQTHTWRISSTWNYKSNVLNTNWISCGHTNQVTYIILKLLLNRLTCWPIVAFLVVVRIADFQGGKCKKVLSFALFNRTKRVLDIIFSCCWWKLD